MTIKLISPNTLSKLRRGAEGLYVKHRDRLPDAKVTIRQDIAKELGLTVKEIKPDPVVIDTKALVGIFDDEAEPESVTPTAMASVPLVDYIEALKKFKIAEPALAQTNANTTGTDKGAK